MLLTEGAILIIAFLQYAITLVADLFIIQGSLYFNNGTIYFINEESFFSGLLIKHT